MQQVGLTSKEMKGVQGGNWALIFVGKYNFDLGELLCFSHNGDIKVWVDINMYYRCAVGDVHEMDIIGAGFKHHSDMLEQLQEMYADVTEKSEVTIITFKKLNKDA